jgi:hypothetical protein
MSTLDLSAYSNIYSALFLKLDITDYEILRMSTHYKPFQITESDSVAYTYTNLGDLVNVSDTSASVRAKPEQITVTIAGIPVTSVQTVTDQAIKGSQIEVRKIYMNSNYQLIGAPIIKFKGLVENYNITEEYPEDASSTIATSSIQLICSTLLDFYENKIAGRRTNPLDQKTYNPLDLSMDRVPTITGSNFQFGAPRK